MEEMHLEFIQIEVIHMAEFTYSRTNKYNSYIWQNKHIDLILIIEIHMESIQIA